MKSVIGRGIVLAGLALATWATSAQAGPAEAGQQILFLNPNPVITGGVVTASGSGFCASATCSNVTIAAGGSLLASNIDIQAGGTFQAQFSALLEPGLHVVTASQQSGGQTIAASSDLIVTVSDSVTPPPVLTPTIPPPTPTAEPTPPNASPTPTPDIGTPEPSPTAPTGEERPSIELRPATTTSGEDVIVTGRDFCAEPGCTPVTISLDGDALLPDVPVDTDGGFEQQFEAPDASGRYQVAADQSDEQGRELKAEATLTVENDDSSDGGGGIAWYIWLTVALFLTGLALSAAVVYWRHRLPRA